MLLAAVFLVAAAQAAEIIGQERLSDPKSFIPVEESPAARAETEGGEKVIRLPCPFSDWDNWRVAWDLEVEADLEEERWLRIRLRAEDPEAVGGVILYFNAGEGWYRNGIGSAPGEWHELIAEKGKSAKEGEPAGWDKVSRIRIAVLPGARRDTAVLLAGLRAASVKEIEDAGRVGPYASLAETKAALSAEARAASYLERAEGLLERARKDGAESARGQELIEAAREKLAQGYLRTLKPRAGELRGAWCHSGTGPEMGWRKAIERMAANGMNALFPNLLWSGIAFYPSERVPVSPEVARRGDQLEEILKTGKRCGVEVHVWKVCWQFGWMADPAVAEPFREANRLMVDREGQTGQWLCPSDEENRRYELEAILELARNYEMAGIHLDYIRYPGPEWCFCPGCRARFEKDLGSKVRNWPADVAEGGTHEKRYREWRMRVITSFVAQVRKSLNELGRDIKLSAAVFPVPQSARETVFQDWTAWVKEGLLDFVCPMNYTESFHEMRGRLKAEMAAVAGRIPIYPGLYTTYSPKHRQSPDMLAAQIAEAREQGAGGFILFEIQDHVLRETLPLLRLGVIAE